MKFMGPERLKSAWVGVVRPRLSKLFLQPNFLSVWVVNRDEPREGTGSLESET